MPLPAVYRNMLAGGLRPSYEMLQAGMNVARKSLRLEMCWYFFRQMRRFGYPPAERDYNTLLACATQSRNLNVVYVARLPPRHTTESTGPALMSSPSPP